MWRSIDPYLNLTIRISLPAACGACLSFRKLEETECQIRSVRGGRHSRE